MVEVTKIGHYEVRGPVGQLLGHFTFTNVPGSQQFAKRAASAKRDYLRDNMTGRVVTKLVRK